MMADSFDRDRDRGDDDAATILREEAAALEKDAVELEAMAHEEEARAHKLEERAREIDPDHQRHHHDGDHDHGGHGDGDHDHRDVVKITLVVNGQPTVVIAPKSELLGDVRRKALEQTQNLAQPAESWEIKTEAGDLLDPDKKVGEYQFGLEATLFLSLSAGVAGD